MLIPVSKSIVPFLAAFGLSVILVSGLNVTTLRKTDPTREAKPSTRSTWSDQGSGFAAGCYGISGIRPGEVTKAPRGSNAPLQIISKPQAKYTDEARANNVQGKVRLKVVLRASGKVGQVIVVEGLPDGLTEQAIEAAKKLRFEPSRKNGAPVTKVITIDYNFTIY